MCYRTLQYWVAWYRGGGLGEVLHRIPGHDSYARAKLTPIQECALAANAALGLFRTVWDAVQWVRDRWHIEYTYSGLHACLQRLRGAPKVPRPQSVNTNPQRQREWKETGLRDAPEEVGVQPGDQVRFCDEMRFAYAHIPHQVLRISDLFRGYKGSEKVKIARPGDNKTSSFLDDTKISIRDVDKHTISDPS